MYDQGGELVELKEDADEGEMLVINDGGPFILHSYGPKGSQGSQ